jgi:uncharacterized protein (TIGR02679 family)
VCHAAQREPHVAHGTVSDLEGGGDLDLRMAEPGCHESAHADRRARAHLLLTAEGWPSAAFHHLVRVAAAGGGQLWYHSEFDWPGIAITASLLRRHGARAWRMSRDDYLAGSKAGSGVRLAGKPRPTPWDPELAEAMCSTGRAVYEEVVVDQLIADLSDWARHSAGIR